MGVGVGEEKRNWVFGWGREAEEDRQLLTADVWRLLVWSPTTAMQSD